MRYTKLLICALALATSAGCGLMTQQAKAVSSGYIGCAPDNIVISDYNMDAVAGKTWVATCNGQRLRCFERDGEGHNSTSHCAPEIKAP